MLDRSENYALHCGQITSVNNAQALFRAKTKEIRECFRVHKHTLLRMMTMSYHKYYNVLGTWNCYPL